MESRQPKMLDFVLCGALYYLGVRIGIDYGVLEEGIAQIWAANAALLTPLLLFQGRKFYVFIAIAYLVEVSLSLAVVPLQATLAYTTANVLECVVAFLLLRRWGVYDYLSSITRFGKFLLAGPVIGALCAAILGGYIYILFNDTATSYLEFVRIWWMGDATGLIIFAPLLMAFWPGSQRARMWAPQLKWYDYGLLALQGFLLLHSLNLLEAGLPFISPGLLLPIAVYFSARTEMRWVLLADAFVSIFYVARLATTGHLFGDMSAADEAMLIQEFILTLSLTTVGLSVLMTEYKAQQRQLNQANQVLERTVAERTRELRTANRKLHRQATTDALTGVHNRHVFFELANKEFSRSRRAGKPFAIVMLDLDYFKKINDTIGHTWGDEVLKGCADKIQTALRASDTVARYGGEEFAVLLPETSRGQALQVMRRVLRSIGETPFMLNERSILVTVSIGCTVLLPEDADMSVALRRADSALLLAKRRGRNRVEFL
ncbi:MAG TPA: diguanylate cyclase [Anaerolineales bacterium]|nr:diguanylate cyclase [Anaerolineales bacterium]HRQ92815.1 diguanylate cyclase [Anaerolineales bacterium]